MTAQIIAVAVFVVMFALIVSEKIERQWVSLGCGLLMLIVVFGICMHDAEAVGEILNYKVFVNRGFWYENSATGNASSGINWSTIVFIYGMMIMVEGMGASGFFRWLCLRIAKAVKYRAVPILITFMVISFVLAMFIDSITVILFLASVTVELAGLLGFSPIPVILAEVFCSNLGGAATMCGDPPNIIIGTSLGYTFADFIRNTGMLAVISLIFTVVYFYLCFRKELAEGTNTEGLKEYPEPVSAIKERGRFAISCIIFASAVILLVTHAITGLTVASIGVMIAVATLLTSGKEAVKFIKKAIIKRCPFLSVFLL